MVKPPLVLEARPVLEFPEGQPSPPDQRCPADLAGRGHPEHPRVRNSRLDLPGLGGLPDLRDLADPRARTGLWVPGGLGVRVRRKAPEIQLGLPGLEARAYSR